MDGLKVALIGAGVGAVLLVAGAGALAWTNAGSRNLALATGTVGAALLLFALQLPFELRAREERDFLTVEYTLDRQQLLIRQWHYGRGIGTAWRMHAEIESSEWLAKKQPQLFVTEQDRDRITRDLVLFSIMTYITRHEFDWQRQVIMFKGDTAGTMFTWDRLSKPSECTPFDEAAIRSHLVSSNISYSGAGLSLTGGTLCLPPKSRFTMDRDSLDIQNPFVRITFRLRPSGSVSYMHPGAGSEVPQMAAGGARYETRLTGVTASVKYSALRAQHRDMEKYRDWVRQLLTGLHEWFQPSNEP